MEFHVHLLHHTNFGFTCWLSIFNSNFSSIRDCVEENPIFSDIELSVRLWPLLLSSKVSISELKWNNHKYSKRIRPLCFVWFASWTRPKVKNYAILMPPFLIFLSFFFQSNRLWTPISHAAAMTALCCFASEFNDKKNIFYCHENQMPWETELTCVKYFCDFYFIFAWLLFCCRFLCWPSSNIIFYFHPLHRLMNLSLASESHKQTIETSIDGTSRDSLGHNHNVIGQYRK